LDFQVKILEARICSLLCWEKDREFNLSAVDLDMGDLSAVTRNLLYYLFQLLGLKRLGIQVLLFVVQ
jgi:hypothetical protein